MADVVVFRLEAPIASFGELAIGEHRGSHRRPTASGVLGLVAAALGLPREAPEHETLTRRWRVAARLDGLGAPIADYHTAQAAPQRKGRRFATRKAELADKNDLGTVVSRRDYWTDAAFTVALWPGEDMQDGPDARAIAEALARPRWTLYAGRRACPLSRPLAARVVSAQTLREAFAAWDAAEKEARRRAGLRDHREGEDFAMDESFAPGGALGAAFAGFALERIETRADRLLSRKRWQFEPRREARARCEPQQEGTTP